MSNCESEPEVDPEVKDLIRNLTLTYGAEIMKSSLIFIYLVYRYWRLLRLSWKFFQSMLIKVFFDNLVGPFKSIMEI